MEDAVSAITSCLSSGWLKANTGGKTPTIASIFTYKRIDLTNGDFVLAYSISHKERPAGLNYAHIDYTDVVSIDIRTQTSRAQLILLRDEARRAIYASRKSLGGYSQATIDTITDLSDKMRGIWRMVIDVRLEKVITTVPS